MEIMPKNKKGIGLEIAFLIVVGVIILILGVMFFASTKYRFLIIGAGCLIGMFYILGQGMRAESFSKGKITLLAILLSISLLFIFGGSVLQTSLGYTSLSVSNVVYDGVSKIRVYGVANGAESISIAFTPAVLNQYLISQGVQATKEVDGSIKFREQKVSFPLIVNSEPINIYGLKDIGLLTSCSVENCQSKVGNLGSVFSTRRAGGTLNLACLCLYKNTLATTGSFSGVKNVNYAVDFTIGSQTATLTENKNSLQIGTGVSVEWVGNLLSNTQIYTPPYKALFQGSKFTKLISTTSYDDAKRAENQFIQCVGDLYSWGMAKDYTACVNTYNTQINSVLNQADKISSYYSLLSAYLKDQPTFVGNNLVLNLQAPDNLPTFIITLDATKVGIVPLKGEPDIITCLSSQEVLSGVDKSVVVVVRNIGSNAGSFQSVLNCNKGIDSYQTENFFEKGEQKDVKILLSGENINKETLQSSCVFTVTDRKSLKSDSCSFNVGVKYNAAKVCTPSTTRCSDSKTLLTCNLDGTTETQTVCNMACVYTGSVASCSDKPPVCGNNICEVGENETTCPVDCENLVCRWYESQLKTNELKYRWWNYVGFGSPTQVPVTTCATSGWVYAMIAGSVVLVLGIVLIVVWKPRRKKKGGEPR